MCFNYINATTLFFFWLIISQEMLRYLLKTPVYQIIFLYFTFKGTDKPHRKNQQDFINARIIISGFIQGSCCMSLFPVGTLDKYIRYKLPQ